MEIKRGWAFWNFRNELLKSKINKNKIKKK